MKRMVDMHLRIAVRILLLLGLTLVVSKLGVAQDNTFERKFHASATTVNKALERMQGVMSGHLPVLDGFAHAGEHAFDRYQRAFFQANAHVITTSAGESVVRVSAKVTAWYDDPKGLHSGYELLRSNGRIETDILDQLSQQLVAGMLPFNQKGSEVARTSPSTDSSPAPISAPQPHLFDSPSTLSSSLSRGLSAADALSPTEAKDSADPERARLRAELEQLEEILKNQSHPKNLAAVKKMGTAVLATPSLSAKPLFLASVHDEFEVLNFNQDWVHVRVSGLSRGWIWRNDLEMPDSVPDTQAAPAKATASDLFRVVREDTAPFPGDWEPLRGKNVRLISIQKTDEKNEDAGPPMKLEFAKSVFAKSYAEMLQKSPELAGIVLIFDSVDGGMIAATQPVLEKWKVGALTDPAFWHSCYFDPPETFSPRTSSPGQ
jgi:hypothetical protein